MPPTTEISTPAPAARSARRRLGRLLLAAAVLAPSTLAVVPAHEVASASTPESTTLAPPAPATTPLPSWAARPTRTMTIPTSIDRTGAKDVHAEMQAFFDSVPNETVVRFPAGARYRMESRLNITKTGLTIDGNGAMVYMTTTGEAQRGNIRFLGGSRVVINNLVVKGANPNSGHLGSFTLALEHQHGLDFRSTKQVALVGVVVTDPYGDFVYMGTVDTKSPWVEDVVIRNSRFERSGRQGITMTGARNVVIENNAMHSMIRSTFDFEPGGTPHGATDVTVRNNDVSFGRLKFVAAAGKGQVDNITVVNNRLTGMTLQVFVNDQSGGTRRNWRVEGNTSDLPGANPNGSIMRFVRVHGIVVRNNVQPMKPNRDMYLVRTDNACDINVSGNTLRNAIGQVIEYGTPKCPVTATAPK